MCITSIFSSRKTHNSGTSKTLEATQKTNEAITYVPRKDKNIYAHIWLTKTQALTQAQVNPIQASSKIFTTTLSHCHRRKDPLEVFTRRSAKRHCSRNLRPKTDQTPPYWQTTPRLGSDVPEFTCNAQLGCLLAMLFSYVVLVKQRKCLLLFFSFLFFSKNT